MILLIDNYDSFTYNLVQRLGEIDASLAIEVRRNDQITLDEIAALAPSHLIVSPAPARPARPASRSLASSASLPKFRRSASAWGINRLARPSALKSSRARRLMHGKTDLVYHDDRGLFAGLENPFQATRYHSLVIRPGTLSDEFEMCAWCDGPEGEKEIMGIRHRRYPLHGLQFHPESFSHPRGSDMLRAFLAIRQPAEAARGK